MIQSKYKVVISEFMSEGAVEQLSERFDVLYKPRLVDDRAELLSQVADVQALIVRNRTQVDATLLQAAPHLLVVGRLGVGLDNIDLKSCKARSVAVIPATGANSRAVAEYVITACLLLVRGCYSSSQEMVAGAWPRTTLSVGSEVAGKTLGLVGFGSIGRLVAQLAQSIGMTVIAHDPAINMNDPIWREVQVAPHAFSNLLEQSDVISLHIPLVPDTRGLFNASVIGSMRAGSVLINTSRGSIVDEPALVCALRNGHLRGAAIDVFAEEPLPPSPDLADVPGLILTPHIAGVTVESNTRVSDMIAKEVSSYLIQRSEG